MNPPSHSDSGDRFTFFPKLPPELRLKIWDMGLPGPRVITILPAGGWSGPDYRFGKCDQSPVHLQVNVEARLSALKKYHLAFDSLDLSRGPKYFRFERDTLELRGCEIHWAEEMPEIRDDLGNIQNLSTHCPDLFWEREEIIKEVFIPFTNLKKFVVQQDLFWLPGNDMYMLG
jgi:hypothetical protein